MNDYDKVKNAFAALKKLGYVTRMASGKYACCGGCLAAEIGQKLSDRGVPESEMKAVYFSRQALDAFDDYGNLGRTLYVNWSSPDPAQIVAAFEAEGLKVEFDGDPASAVGVAAPLNRVELHEAEEQARYTNLHEALVADLRELGTLKQEFLETTNIVQMDRIAERCKTLQYSINTYRDALDRAPVRWQY